MVDAPLQRVEVSPLLAITLARGDNLQFKDTQSRLNRQRCRGCRGPSEHSHLIVAGDTPLLRHRIRDALVCEAA